jgi:hypothetical protein
VLWHIFATVNKLIFYVRKIICMCICAHVALMGQLAGRWQPPDANKHRGAYSPKENTPMQMQVVRHVTQVSDLRPALRFTNVSVPKWIAIEGRYRYEIVNPLADMFIAGVYLNAQNQEITTKPFGALDDALYFLETLRLGNQGAM